MHDAKSYLPFYENLLMQDSTGVSANRHFDCPFCESESKFTVNVETGKGQCMSGSCGETVNHISMMTKYHQAWLDCTEDSDLIRLSKLRGIPVADLKAAKLAYDSYEKRWFLPFKNPFTPHLCNIGTFIESGQSPFRIYKCTNSVGTVPLTLYNPYQKLNNPSASSLIICEGEWDSIAMLSALRQKTTTGFLEGEKHPPAVLGVPGASIFPEQCYRWLAKFKTIYLAYDNDDAGRKGLSKAAKILQGLGKSFQTILWDNLSVEDGYDIRDLFIERDKETFSVFVSNLGNYEIDTDEDVDPEKLSDGYVASVLDIPAIPTYQQYLEKYASDLYLTDENLDAIAITAAIASSQYMHGEPLWFFMVSPPGAGKTMLIESYGGNNEYFGAASRITAKSLVSGWGGGGGETSMLTRMNSKCFFIKDFTVVLGMDKSAQKEVFNLFRDIYDGTLDISFGNGKRLNFHNIRFNLIAGVTDAINEVNDASMGERFLRYDYSGASIDDSLMIESALDGFGQTTSRKTNLTNATLGYMNTLLLPENRWDVEGLPRMSESSKKAISCLARYTAFIRTRAETDRTDGLKYRPRREVGTRLALQFAKLAYALEKVFNPKLQIPANGTLDFCDDTLRLIAKIAHDSSTGFHQEIINTLYDNPRIDRQALQKKLRLTPTTVQRRMENMEATKIVTYAIRTEEYDKVAGRPPYIYRVHDNFKPVVEAFRTYYQPRNS